MGRKRPSLRNYLTEGDDARDLDILDAPPYIDSLSEEMAGSLLESCPSEPLTSSEWAVAARCALLNSKGTKPSVELLAGMFRSDDRDSILSSVEALTDRNVLSLEDGVLTVTDPSLWLACDSGESDEIPEEDDRIDVDPMDMLKEEDRSLWAPMLRSVEPLPLVLSEIKKRFDEADPVVTQFFVLRKVEESLVPVTRSSQIRPPIKAMLIWSEGEGADFYLEF
ncbi:hypothetical protein L2W58_06190 [Dethiosulfovibrio sp. F2B]|uniref:hypothetical protein n=1 Tax=Dethiosulfovibrio faecalis TaxID=2720018 RepID=UPI001F45005A|nr:hypothetical protein [Dethiosulfovibrio faecalis]MCF4151388.1 hypothetical protein [Dethiosulfovibrio faecalis]